MADETLPTLPELARTLPARGTTLVGAFAVGATTEDLARRAVAALWESLSPLGPLHVFVTVRKVRQRKPYLLVGAWEGVDRSPAGLDLLVRTGSGYAPRLSLPLSTVEGIAVYAAPAVSDTTGEGR